MSVIRVAAHVHSDWSYDGSYSLARIAAEFGRRGYDAVLLAEHDLTFDDDRLAAYRIACAGASRDGIRLIVGIEHRDPANTVHIPVWGVPHFLGAGVPTTELLNAARARDGFAVLAHPGRRDTQDALDPGCLEALDGLELWNRKYDGIAPGPRAVAALAARRR